jgi:hypothetical protein
VTPPATTTTKVSGLINPPMSEPMESPSIPNSPTKYGQICSPELQLMSLRSAYSEETSSEGPQAFDSHGQRAPYYEGPYYIKFDESGKKIKYRWCKFSLCLLATVCF